MWVLVILIFLGDTGTSWTKEFASSEACEQGAIETTVRASLAGASKVVYRCQEAGGADAQQVAMDMFNELMKEAGVDEDSFLGH